MYFQRHILKLIKPMQVITLVVLTAVAVITLTLLWSSQLNAKTVLEQQLLPAEIRAFLKQRLYADALPPINRLAQFNKNAEAAFWLANFYQCGKIVNFDCQQAVTQYQNAIDWTTLPSLKTRATAEWAWIHAACKQNGFKNNFAQAEIEATKLAAENPSAYRLDTLAAAQASTGNFKLAVQTQQNALKLLNQQNTNQSISEFTIKAFNDRLTQYANRRPAILNAQNASINCNAFGNN